MEAEPLGLQLDESDYTRLIETGRSIKHAIMDQMSIEHPFEPDLSFLYGTIFTGPPLTPSHHSRNVCIFCRRLKSIDRRPVSGVSRSRPRFITRRVICRAACPSPSKASLAVPMTVTVMEKLGVRSTRSHHPRGQWISPLHGERASSGSILRTPLRNGIHPALSADLRDERIPIERGAR